MYTRRVAFLWIRTYNTYIKVFFNLGYMSTTWTRLTPQELALHDAGELLPQSAQILQEDIESGRVVLKTVENTADILGEKPE